MAGSSRLLPTVSVTSQSMRTARDNGHHDDEQREHPYSRPRKAIAPLWIAFAYELDLFAASVLAKKVVGQDARECESHQARRDGDVQEDQYPPPQKGLP